MATEAPPKVVAASSLTSGSILVEDVRVDQCEEPLACSGDVIDTAIIQRFHEHAVEAVRVRDGEQPAEAPVEAPAADTDDSATPGGTDPESANAGTQTTGDTSGDAQPDPGDDEAKDDASAKAQQFIESAARSALKQMGRRFKRCDISHECMRTLVHSCALSQAKRAMQEQTGDS